MLQTTLPPVGSVVTASQKVETARSPGGASYGFIAPTGQGPDQAIVKSYRTVNGQTYVDLDVGAKIPGQGTGWAKVQNIIPFQSASQSPIASPQPVAGDATTPTEGPDVRESIASLEKSLKQGAVTAEQEQADVQPFLDSYNEALKDEKAAAEVEVRPDAEIKAEVEAAITPDLPFPEVPQLTELFSSLRTDHGLEQLEFKLNELTASEDNIYARLRERIGLEEGKPVPLNVIQGRVSETESQEMEVLDFVGRQKSRLVNELKTKYQLVDTLMNLNNLDYGNAVKAYNTQFQNNLSIFNTFSAVKAEEKADIRRVQEAATEERQVAEGRFLDEKSQIAGERRAEQRRGKEKAEDFQVQMIEWERQDVERATDAARSNLQIYTNLITEGGLKMDQLPQETQLQIQQLEIQSGLGRGFMDGVQQVAQATGSDVISTTTRQDSSGTKWADVIMQSPTGEIYVDTRQLGAERLPQTAGGSGGGAPSVSMLNFEKEQQFQGAQGAMSAQLSSLTGDDGHVSPGNYRLYKQTWTERGYEPDLYDDLYKRFVNPSHFEEYGVTSTDARTYLFEVSP